MDAATPQLLLHKILIIIINIYGEFRSISIRPNMVHFPIKLVISNTAILIGLVRNGRANVQCACEMIKFEKARAAILSDEWRNDGGKVQ